jgi:hypothetical protein
MLTDTMIEQRLAALESAVAEIQRRLADTTRAPNWIERFRGSFKNEPAFAEVVEYGRTIRAAYSSQQANGS